MLSLWSQGSVLSIGSAGSGLLQRLLAAGVGASGADLPVPE
ncbi:hypothetical protein [Frankia sp. R82]|nr:hypothetical protein [Frankia sp. R82]